MSMESSPEIAKLKPFLALAKEYEGFFPIASLYIKQYASNKLMEIYKKFKSEGNDDPTLKQTLNAWISEIEGMRQKYSDQVKTKEENLQEIESFTLNVFIRADDEERENRFNLQTMKAFQACSKLFEVLNYLGVPSEDLAQKKKYAMAKAVEINRKLKNPELYVPKPSNENPPNEESKSFEPENQENFRPPVNPSNEMKSNMGYLNKSVKNQVFQEEGNPERESVERMMGYIQRNKKDLAVYGYESERPKIIKQNENNNFEGKVAGNTPNPKNFSNQPPSNFQNFTPTPNIRQEPPPQNMANLKPQAKTRELMSTIANQKMSLVAIKDKVQKECQNAITDINANRIPQAKNDLENAINLIRQLRK